MRKRNCLSKIFHSIDIFGLKTEFQIDQKQRFTTTSGSFFTLIYIGLMILLFFSFGSDMIQRVSPDTTISQIYQTVPSPSEVSRNQYSFVFGMQDSTANHFIDEEIYTVSMIYGYKNQTTGKTVKVSIAVEPCTEDNLPYNKKIANYFRAQATNLSDLYCISKKNQQKLVIEGAWDQPRYGYLQWKINPCNSSQKVCKSDEEIQAKLQRGYYGFYSIDNLIDLTDYESPANAFGRNYFISTTSSQRKLIFRYLKTNHIRTNDGWITDSFHEEDDFSFDYDQESFDFLTGPGTIVDMTIRKSYYELIHTRKYKKIQNVFAEMTGFLQIIFVVLYFLSKPFIKKEYYETLTNNIYNFEVDEDEKHEKKKKKKEEDLKTFKSILVQEGELEKGSSPKNNKLTTRELVKKKKNDDKLADLLLQVKETPLKFSMTENFKSFCIKNPELEAKKQQQQVGVSSIFSKLDIKYVLKKFSELDKLKMLLLNEDQYNLFEYLPKPLIMKNAKIHLNYIKEKIISPERKFTQSAEIITHHNDNVLKAKIVKNSYLNIIKKKKEMNEIDLKLIESLDEEIMQFLKENEEEIEFERKSMEDAERESIFSEKKEEFMGKMKDSPLKIEMQKY